MRRPLDVVFEGGGARGLAQNGAVQALEDAGYGFRRLVGTSAGAITAALCAMGYDGSDLRRISLETRADGRSRMTEFMGEPHGFADLLRDDSVFADLFARLAVPGALEHALITGLVHVPGAGHVVSLVEDGGWYSARGFVEWLGEHIERAVGDPFVTFDQLHRATGRDLTVVASDTADATELVLNHRTSPDCPVLWGVRMSMGIPFLWPEVVWQRSWGTHLGRDITGHTVVDGGVSSNFALGLLVGAGLDVPMGPPPREPADVVGLWIDLDAEVPGAPAPRPGASLHGLSHSRVLRRLVRLVDTLMAGSDRMVAAAHEGLVCRLPAKGYGVTEFDMAPERITALVDAGDRAARAWLRDQRES
ncbi:MAG: patatin-like phospholipase family protein [Myxococcota bacterium]